MEELLLGPMISLTSFSLFCSQNWHFFMFEQSFFFFLKPDEGDGCLLITLPCTTVPPPNPNPPPPTVLHDNKLTHTDLKPENILFISSDFSLVYNADKVCVLNDFFFCFISLNTTFTLAGTTGTILSPLKFPPLPCFCLDNLSVDPHLPTCCFSTLI